jgi:hypothetical protein
MDVTFLLFVSLGSSTVQLHDTLGNTRACACSEAGSGRQNGDRVEDVLPNNSVLLCVFMAKMTQCKRY